jgi:hypothetical protein
MNWTAKESGFGFWQGQEFFFHGVQIGSGAEPAFCPVSRPLFLEVKRPEREADHPSPPSADVKNDLLFS